MMLNSARDFFCNFSFIFSSFPVGEGRDDGSRQTARFPNGTTSGVPATGSSIIMQRMP